jgi:diacylglycerol kinase family enzyme
MRVLLIHKGKKNNDTRKREILDLERRFEKKNIIIEATKLKKEPEDLRKYIRSEKIDAVIVAGGDGTLNYVVSEIAEEEIPVGIIPKGTFNHFAHDLGLSENIDECIDVIASGNIAYVDVAEVNGKVFLNNSSIGAYPLALIMRDRYEKGSGWSKQFAMIRAVTKIFFVFPTMTVTIKTDADTYTQTTPFVFIGNNVYTSGKRDKLTEGVLSIYTANRKSRWGILFMGLLSAINKLEDKYFDEHITKSAVLEIQQTKINVAIDGEMIKEESPLKYIIRPRKLPVFVPTKKKE